MTIRIVFICTLALTVVSAAAATWLASAGRETRTRRIVAQRLSQVTLLGAGAVYAMLAGQSD